MANTGGYLLGLAFGPGGLLYVCDKKRRAVLSVDVANGTVCSTSPPPRGSSCSRPTTSYSIPAERSVRLGFGRMGKRLGQDRRGGSRGNGFGGSAAASSTFPTASRSTRAEPGCTRSRSAEPRVSRIALDGERDPEALAEIVLRLPHAVPDGLAFTDTGRLLVSCYRPDTVFEWEPGAEARPIAEDWTGPRAVRADQSRLRRPRHDRLRHRQPRLGPPHRDP
ncbi:MAG: hypothetical protein WDM88_05015 [Galbitalea sp.]